MPDKCLQCGNCCRHVALEIDTPEDKEDYENIYWYLLHKDVFVYIAESEEYEDEEEWYVEFQTPCTALNDDNTCKIYKDRPELCRNYGSEECVMNDMESNEIEYFKTAEDFLKYLKIKKGVILRDINAENLPK